MADKKSSTIIPENRFWKFVETTANGCWEWKGCRDKDGYGIFSFRNKRQYVRAHRFSFELHKGEIGEGLLILHHCDNPSCVRPEHLYSGTHADNNRDVNLRNRRNDRTKITVESASQIRFLLQSGSKPTELAKLYNVSCFTIWNIKAKRNWK